MKAKGLQITCDRCGKTGFFKATNEKETDGGFTRWSEFESYKDWGYKCIGDKGYDLCPECLKGYEAITADYLKACESFIANNK